MRSPVGISRTTVQRALQSAALAAAVAVLATGCGSGTVQRVAPGVDQSTTSTGADGTDWSTQARNVDLSIKNAVVQLGASGTARLYFTVDNAGPVTEHLAVVSVPGLGQATLQGSAGPVNALSTAGIMIDSGSSAVFGAGAPAVVLPSAKGLTPGGTTPVLLEFGIAGLVHLTVPVKAA
ncbi:hypothetical protein [Streptacidiphilus sp. P02-A3a]|uniref:hypothetical protein n=1 Tax=Streptacidiphilus sp. P02-A3a TaxID=2704468 RepID=UPI0015F8F70D|nr:hypothetical protein [Streptacidiphilus sp. P02-A3a]QMU72945.1 hypothetical protein GXP74_36605 [Streptacidiphilus sp. P02-A3a]